MMIGGFVQKQNVIFIGFLHYCNEILGLILYTPIIQSISVQSSTVWFLRKNYNNNQNKITILDLLYVTVR